MKGIHSLFQFYFCFNNLFNLFLMTSDKVYFIMNLLEVVSHHLARRCERNEG